LVKPSTVHTVKPTSKKFAFRKCVAFIVLRKTGFFCLVAQPGKEEAYLDSWSRRWAHWNGRDGREPALSRIPKGSP
jgi:hypothetical protein